MKIIGYLIVDGTAREVALKVIELSNAGWEPQGGISATVCGMTYTFFQAMIKKEANE